MKYLIIGAAGFIGSQLVGKIIKYGNEVDIIDDSSSGYIENLPLSVREKITNRFVRNN